LIARAHLTAGVSAAVDDLLRASPVDEALNRFCKDRPDDIMADGATWADDAKNREKTGVWHYIDIPRSVNSAASAGPSGVEPWCPPIGPSVEGKNRPGCITNAIDYELAILRDKARSSADRATALRYIIHFAGDIHQPLHDIDNNDQGGNCTVIRFFGEEQPANLHAIWDYKLIQRALERSGLSPQAYAMALDKRFADKFATLSTANADDPVAWAWETHAIALSNTYGNLEPGIPLADADPKADPQAACAAERDKVRSLSIAIGDPYFDAAMLAIDERLSTAGFRLAALLNESLR
jgi:hypothetical protein